VGLKWTNGYKPQNHRNCMSLPERTGVQPAKDCYSLVDAFYLEDGISNLVHHTSLFAMFESVQFGCQPGTNE
jgi:hypothetical protein